MRAEATAPIERLQFAALVDAESVGGIAAIETEDLRGLRSAGSGGEQGQKKNTEETKL